MLQPTAHSNMKKKAVLINNEKESRTNKELQGLTAWRGEKRRQRRRRRHGEKKRRGPRVKVQRGKGRVRRKGRRKEEKKQHYLMGIVDMIESE